MAPTELGIETWYQAAGGEKLIEGATNSFTPLSRRAWSVTMSAARVCVCATVCGRPHMSSTSPVRPPAAPLRTRVRVAVLIAPTETPTQNTDDADQVATVAPFEFATAARVVFGCGTSARVPALVKELTELEGCADKPVLIVAGVSDRFSAPLVISLREAGVESFVYHHPAGEPTVATAEAAIKVAVDNACACVIAIGGGTPVDTGKCVAAVLTNGGSHPDLYDFLEVVGRARALTKRCAPFIAVPTTAGPGAEVTKNSVLEAGDRKVSMRHPFMLPSVVVIDPELTLSMPKEVTAHTGLGTYALHTS